MSDDGEAKREERDTPVAAESTSRRSRAPAKAPGSRPKGRAPSASKRPPRPRAPREASRVSAPPEPLHDAARCVPLVAAPSIDEQFFRAGDSTPPLVMDTPAIDEAPVTAFEAAPRRRRARLTKYVGVAVALSAALCLAAGVRAALARVSHEPDAVTEAAIAHVTRAAARGEAHEPLSTTVDRVAPSLDSAAEAKDEARHALELRRPNDAIAAGERSVALDASDADAWLVLGAAYQDAGKDADARRCFAECARRATRGAVRECGFMLP